MNNIPYPLREKPKAGMATTYMAYLAIEALRATGRSSKVIWGGGHPQLPVRSENWELSEVKDETTLPIEIQRRINILRYYDIPIKEVLIAHELPPPKPMKELPAPKEIPSVASPNRRRRVRVVKKVSHHRPFDWKPIDRLAKAVAVLAIASAAIVAIPYILMAVVSMIGAFFTALAGALTPILLIGGLLFLGCGTDPIVIVVLNDSAQSWILAGMWYE